MEKRKNIVAGNWKMNKTFPEAESLLKEIDFYLTDKKLNCEVVVGLPSIYLQYANSNFKHLRVSSQDLSRHSSGAYTGEISAEMLSSIQVPYCIVGHSERRQYHNETDQIIKDKIKAALKHSLIPIYCNGEILEDRNQSKHFEIVENQTVTALFDLSSEEIKKVVIAYEPVWAIGTGLTASASQAQEMHQFIRGLIAKKYDQQTADSISILYGGSVKPNNAKEIFSQKDIDGGLIGGASLNFKDFKPLIDLYL